MLSIENRILTILCISILLLINCSVDRARSDEFDSTEYYKERNWSEPSKGGVNLSVFVYRDMNRNNIYDLLDRPFASAIVKITSPSGVEFISRSNLAGFANFRASYVEPFVEVSEVGRYHITVLPPPGYNIVTNNESQYIEISHLSGSPSNFIAKYLPSPVGLLPKLTIDIGISSKKSSMYIESPSGGIFDSRNIINSEGIDAVPGIWKFRSDRTSVYSLDIRVEQSPIIISDTADLLPFSGAEIIVVDFDDLVSNVGIVEVPNGYRDFGWKNWVVTHNLFYRLEGYINGTVSGDYVGYLGSGHPAEISRSKPFDFIGGFFSVNEELGAGEVLNISAWSGDDLKFEDIIELSPYIPVYFFAGYANVDRIEFRSRHYWQVIADNLEFISRDF